MKKFTIHTGLAVPLDRDNVDTDAIMPKQFMKSIARTGFGPYLFDEWRFEDPGYFGKPPEMRVLRKEFIINKRRYQGASILVSGSNFGCGSSREHAPWALQQFGFDVIIAKSFADIFQNNCKKIGLLPVVLASNVVVDLLNLIEMTDGYELTVDLNSQIVTGSGGFSAPFEFGRKERDRMMNGLDDVAATLQCLDEISDFEYEYFSKRPWLK
ncbi:3-isopropylmalate dehydratase small subunit [Burkholderia sp. BCC1977]|uniref:3-isopropylmalate dehydratase small subunit n=1 Tax=Burkholderia sp. BCC1977 TaxID=2817440 RepID=UPI002ABD94A1|nr:3-isopropylmalate dehydratase small subunit [Burkholderia sp. BCC1977]